MAVWQHYDIHVGTGMQRFAVLRCAVLRSGPFPPRSFVFLLSFFLSFCFSSFINSLFVCFIIIIIIVVIVTFVVVIVCVMYVMCVFVPVPAGAVRFVSYA